MKIQMFSVLVPLLLTAELFSQSLPAPKLYPLWDYAGTYADAPGHPIEMVAGDALFAVQDEAKYALQQTGPDEFTTAIQHKLPFKRDLDGRITGYTESLRRSAESHHGEDRPAGTDRGKALKPDPAQLESLSV